MSSSAPPHTGPITPPKEGDVLAGKYRIEKILGRGGMGLVVAATHLQLGQLVAIKFLFQPGNREVVARFLREARAAVRLRSEHVARVIDVGELENGAPYMVMEHLRGSDLSDQIRAHGALPMTTAVDYVLQTCEAMAEAHSAGIIHRDLKPANLFLTTTPDGTKSVKVLDFGISKVGGGTDDQGVEGMQLTKTEMVLGSPLYMSPEQLKSSKDVDVRADIWALGCILYQLLTGNVPFNTGVFSELVLKVNLEPPTPLATYRGDIPPALEAAVMKCLEKKPEGRFQNVGELALAIADFGPETGRLSAEKAARVIEAAGQTVRAPAGFERGGSLVPGAATRSGAMTAGTWVPAAPGGTMQTGVGAISALGPNRSTEGGTSVGNTSGAGTTASNPPVGPRVLAGRGLVAALVLVALLAGALTVTFLGRRGSSAAGGSSTNAGTGAETKPATSLSTGPDIRPAGDAPPASAAPEASSATPQAVSPTGSASASGAPFAQPSATGSTPRGGASQTPTTKPTSTPPKATTTTAPPDNPFNQAGKLGDKY